MGKSALRALTCAGFMALLLAVAGGASAKSVHRVTAKQRIVTATQLVGKYHRSQFARGQRRGVLSVATRARRRTRGHSSACKVLFAADALHAYLALPTVWKHNRVPKATVKRAAGLLTVAERALLRQAGSKCAKPAHTHRLFAHVGGIGSAKVSPPHSEPEQGDGLDKGIPQGKLRPIKHIGGTSGLAPDLHGSAPAAAHGGPFATIADDSFNFFRNSDVGIPPRQASPQEPTTAIDPSSGVAWYTGNTSDGLSTDNGRTWTLFDPSNVLPDQGLSFCCDQIVSYSTTYHVFVWVSQYWCNGGGCFTTDSKGNTVCRSDGAANRIRIAVASPAALRANASNPGRAWTYWDVTPGLIGQPRNAWFDRSDMSVNPLNMNWGVDILCGNASNLNSRISLAQLAARGTVTLSYTTNAGARTTSQGNGTTTYFAGSDSLSQALIWSWAPYSGTLFRHDINHSSVPINNIGITGSDGGNWYDRFGIFPGEVESAALSGNTLYLAQGTGRDQCTANCSTAHPTLHHVFDQPAILISKYDVNTWHEIGERWLWNPTLAFGWPALSTDRAGDVGIVFRASATNHNAQPVAGFLTPREQFVYAEPEGSPYETGDYYSLRPGRTNRSFVMTAQTYEANSSGGHDMHWQYIEYGLGAAPYVSPPSVHINSPGNLASFTTGANVGYSAAVSDPIDGTLPSAAIRWTEDGAFIGSGPAINHVENKIGTHVVTVTATNGDGKSASSSVTIHVNPAYVPIGVTITSPANGSRFQATLSGNLYCADVSFVSAETGGAGSPGYSWTDSLDGGAPQKVSGAPSPTLTLCTAAGTRTATHVLTVTATDGRSTATAQDSVTLFPGPATG